MARSLLLELLREVRLQLRHVSELIIAIQANERRFQESLLIALGYDELLFNISD